MPALVDQPVFTPVARTRQAFAPPVELPAKVWMSGLLLPLNPSALAAPKPAEGSGVAFAPTVRLSKFHAVSVVLAWAVRQSMAAALANRVVSFILIMVGFGEA